MGQNKYFSYIVGFLAGLIPEMTVAYIFMHLTDGSWSSFWIAYFSIQVFYFVVWFFRTGVGWAVYFLFLKKQMVEGIYQLLVKGKFPYPGQYYIGDGITYFEDVAKNVNNEKLEENVQLQAVHIWAEMKTYDSVGQWRLLSQVKNSAKIALERYYDLNSKS